MLSDVLVDVGQHLSVHLGKFCAKEFKKQIVITIFQFYSVAMERVIEISILSLCVDFIK